MSEIEKQEKNDEVGLIDFVVVLLKYKKMIIMVTVFSMLFILAFSVVSLILPKEKSFLPNEYTPKALMLINDSQSSSNSLSSMISNSGLSGIANLAGLSTKGGSTYSALALFLVTTNSFLDSIIDKYNFIDEWEIEKSPRANSRKILSEKLKTEFDDGSGVLSLSFTDINPELAQEVVNYSVDYLEQRFLSMGIDKSKLEKENLEINIQNTYNDIINLQKQIQDMERQGATYSSSFVLDVKRLELELDAKQQVYKQLYTQYEVLKITMASETPIFQIIERPEIPDMKSGPSRGKLCIIVTFAAFFVSVFIALLRNAINNLKNDKEAMKKIKGDN